MKDFLEVADDSQHGKGSFNDHALVPGSFLTEFEMVRRTVGITEAQVGQDDGLTVEVSSKAIKVLVRMLRRFALTLVCVYLLITSPTVNADQAVTHRDMSEIVGVTHMGGKPGEPATNKKLRGDWLIQADGSYTPTWD